MSYHELTQKLLKYVCDQFNYAIDTEITTWIEQKAQEIHRIEREGYRGTEVREILGLSEKEKDPVMKWDGETLTKEVGMKEWCEHCDIKLGKDGVYHNHAYAYAWKFCPFCAAPRPAEKKEPKLWEIFKCISDKHQVEGILSGWNEYANAALKAVLEIINRMPYVVYGETKDGEEVIHINKENLKRRLLELGHKDSK